MKLDVVPCDYVANRMLHGAFGTMDRRGEQVPIVDAISGIHSLTQEDIASKIVSFFGPGQKHSIRRPFLRILAPTSNSSCARSIAQDRRAVLAQKVALKLGFQRKLVARLAVVEMTLDKVEDQLSFFNHFEFHVHSMDTILDIYPGYDANEYMDIMIRGVCRHLLNKTDKAKVPKLMSDSAAFEALENQSSSPVQAN